MIPEGIALRPEPVILALVGLAKRCIALATHPGGLRALASTLPILTSRLAVSSQMCMCMRGELSETLPEAGSKAVCVVFCFTGSIVVGIFCCTLYRVDCYWQRVR